jgi:predicted enzyme related to lactoylglutathione lyase
VATISIQGVNAIMIYAKDAALLAAWYSEHLGVETRLDPSDGNYYGDIADRANGTVIHWGIYPCKQPVSEGSRAMMVNFRVANMPEALSALGNQGIVIDDRVDTPYGLFAYLRDPEGNPIELWAEATSSGD